QCQEELVDCIPNRRVLERHKTATTCSAARSLLCFGLHLEEMGQRGSPYVIGAQTGFSRRLDTVGELVSSGSAVPSAWQRPKSWSAPWACPSTNYCCGWG